MAPLLQMSIDGIQSASVIGAGKHSMIHPYQSLSWLNREGYSTGARRWYMCCPKSAKTLTADLRNVATRDTGFGLFGLSTTLKYYRYGHGFLLQDSKPIQIGTGSFTTLAPHHAILPSSLCLAA